MGLKYYMKHAVNILLEGKYNHPYCKQWDKTLNNLMKNHPCVEVSKQLVKIGDCEIWIWNPFWSYGWLYSLNGYIVEDEVRRRPSVKTMLRFEKFLDEIRKEQKIKKELELKEKYAKLLEQIQ